MIAAARARGLRHRLRCLPLCRRRQSAEEPAAALGAGRRHTRRCWRGWRSPRRARASAPRSTATGSTIGAASRPGNACRSRSRRTCRRPPARPSPALASGASRDPIDQLCDHLIDDNGATRVLITSIAEDDIRTIVRSPTALVGSDGNCVATYGTVSQGMPHPRFYGTFPRIIGHYVRDERLAAARAGDPQDDRRDRARRSKLRDRGLLGKATAPMSRSSTRPISATWRPTPTRTVPERRRAPASSSTASSSSTNAAHTGATPGVVLRRDRDGRVG